MRRFAEKMMKRATYIKFLFFLISIMLFSCVKDASIGKAILCNNPSNNQCNEDIASFYGVETDTIHLFVTLNNAPKNIKVDITWYYQAAESEKEVIYQKNLMQAVNENVSRITVFLLGISILLLFISFALINNTVRLSIYSKRFLIHTMKLVGATGSFIRQPFMIQGIFTGIVSACIAMGLLSLLVVSFQTELGGIITLESIDFMLVSFVVMIAVGIIITFVSTYFAVNRYLRIKLNDMYYM